MTAKVLQDVLQHVKSWSEEAQEDLAQIAREIDTQLAGRAYHATTEELAALDEAECSGVASEEEVEAAFNSFRRE
jgi:primosomal replication protein N